MRRDPTVCIKAVRVALLQAGASGLDVPGIVAELGLDPAVLADPYARAPHRLVAHLWRALPERTGDQAFGLHAAERAHALNFDAIDGVFRHAETLGDVLSALSRYQRLLHEGATVEVTRGPEDARVEIRFQCAEPAPRHFVEMILAMWALRSRSLAGEGFRLLEVALPHAPPEDGREHRRVYGVTPRFRAETTGIRCDARALDAPVKGADATLGVVLDRHVRAELDRLPRADDVTGLVADRVRRELGDGVPDLDRVARELGQSSRSLQRSLAAAGTSFQRVADEVRRERAFELVAGSDVTLTEIAFLAGFAELSAFTRAFRRWAGCSPSQYRAKTALRSA